MRTALSVCLEGRAGDCVTKIGIRNPTQFVVGVRIDNNKGVSNAFNQWNQGSGCDWIYIAVAARHPDSDFIDNLSLAGLYMTTISERQPRP